MQVVCLMQETLLLLVMFGFSTMQAAGVCLGFEVALLWGALMTSAVTRAPFFQTGPVSRHDHHLLGRLPRFACLPLEIVVMFDFQRIEGVL